VGTVWVAVSYVAVSAQLKLFNVKFGADVASIGFFPSEEWKEELFILHALFQEVCYFAFSGYAEVDAFGVFYS
jgi:hypothetical protein